MNHNHKVFKNIDDKSFHRRVQIVFCSIPQATGRTVTMVFTDLSLILMICSMMMKTITEEMIRMVLVTFIASLEKGTVVATHLQVNFKDTRKSSCINARSIPPAVHNCPGSVCVLGGGGVTPVLS